MNRSIRPAAAISLLIATIAIAGLPAVQAPGAIAQPAGERTPPPVSPVPIHVPGPDAIVANDADVAPPTPAPTRAVPPDMAQRVLDAARDRDPRVVAASPPTAGGDNVLVAAASGTDNRMQMDITDAGVIYVAAELAALQHVVHVYRSTDNGATFSWFGTIAGTPSERIYLNRLLVCEGNVNRVYVLYTQGPVAPGDHEVKVAWEDLTQSVATWDTRTVFPKGGGLAFSAGAMASDDLSFASFYLYAVAKSGPTLDPGFIYFCRSTDFGDTWSAPYIISSAANGETPDVSYGFGNAVHAAWSIRTSETAVRYRRALNWANAGIADWDPVLIITSLINGNNEVNPDIQASGQNAVAILYYDWADGRNHLRVSTDAGATWPTISEVTTTFGSYGATTDESDTRSLSLSEATSEFVLAGAQIGLDRDIAFQVASTATPLTWSTPAIVSAVGLSTNPHAAAMKSPAQGNRVAIAWTRRSPLSGFDTDIWFDAEWRSDPGYPVTEFTLELGPGGGSATERSPALANMDGDPELEIIFSDRSGDLYVVNHLGAVEPGWPKALGGVTNLAVGDLTGDGTMEIVVGDESGTVHAFRGNGSYYSSAFPVIVGSGVTAVSIGALGGSSARGIVVANGTFLSVMNPTGSIDQSWVFPHTFTDPAAIGDLTGDGTVEMITVNEDFVHVQRLGVTGSVAFRQFPGKYIAQQAALADMDLDGDLEIIVCTVQGDVYVMHHTMTDMAGFPISIPANGEMLAPAVSQILSTSEPEIAVAQNEYMHLFLSNGTEPAGWPRNVPAFLTYSFLGGAITTHMNPSYGGSVIAGTFDAEGQSFPNNGAAVQIGWPRSLLGRCRTTPAAGDIDLDGSNEIVFVTETHLEVFDVNETPDWFGFPFWPMHGQNAQRTGCYECNELLPTAVDTPPALSRLRFQEPFPNPASGAGLTFSYQLPVYAAVTLEVFDVAGRRVRTVVKREESAGERSVRFDGRGASGLTLPSGVYFARLTVRGPGISEKVVRKFSFVQ